MLLSDPLTTSGIVLAQKAVKTVVQSSLVDSVRNGVVDFLTKQIQDLGKKELADRIAGMRSDAKLRGQIQGAIERATKRWTEDYADRDFVIAVAQDTQFADLPSVQAAVQAIARNPLNPVPVETLRGKFTEVLPKRFDPERTERGVVAWLEILREEFVGVSDLRQALAVAAEIQTARSTGLAAEVLLRLDDTLRRMETGPTPTEQTLRDYLHWVIDQHYYLDPRGTMQTVRQVQVHLQDVYVSLEAEAQAPLSTLDRRLFEYELESLVERDDLVLEAKEDLRENLLARYATEEARVDTKPVELAELVCKHAKLVILGDPGAGKTTLLRYLALRHAQALLNGEPEIPDLGPVRLPVYLRIAHYAEQGNGRSLVDYVPACVRGQEDADPAIAALMRESLGQGKCLVLLDGLDEVIEPSQRAEIAAQIDALIRTHEHTGNRFVVTSRVAGYRTAPLAGDMPHYCVRDMNDEQIQRFLEQWCNAVERFQTPELAPEAQAQKAQAEIDDIMRAIQSTPGVKRLAANPLLLRVLALIHRTGARLPQRRIELYRLAADTLIRDWELARGIPQAALVREADANRLLAELAAWMHQEKPAGIATEGEVKAHLAGVLGQLQGKDADHPDVQSAVDDFLARIRQHTGLFVERAPRRYGFMHLTFEEYFAARWLVARPREAAKRIRNKLHRPRWEEPILLAIGFYGMEFPDDVSELVEEAILGKNLSGPSPYEDILHRDLLFAVRVLGDQDVSVILCRKLLQDMVALLWEDNGALKYMPLQVHITRMICMLRGSQAEADLLRVLLVALKETRAYIRVGAAWALINFTDPREAVAVLLAALKDESANIRAHAVKALGDATDRPEVIRALLTALKDKSQNVRTNVINVLRTVRLSAETVPVLLAALKDESDLVRAGTAEALKYTTPQPEVISALIEAEEDKSENVRTSARSAILVVALSAGAIAGVVIDRERKDLVGRFLYIFDHTPAEPEAIPAFLAALNDDSADIRAHAVWKLRKATFQVEVIYALLAALKDENEDVRVIASYALTKATLSTEAVTILLSALKDDNDLVRAEAAKALGNFIAQSDVTTALLVALKDESDLVRAKAAGALGNAAVQTEVVTALLAALKDESDYVHAQAAGALGNAAAQTEVTTALLAALKDESDHVRAQAAGALGNAAAQTEVTTALLAALKDESDHVRAQAAGALGNVAAQTEVTTALLDALKDESPIVQSEVRSALEYARLPIENVNDVLAMLKDENAQVRESAGEILYRFASQSLARVLPEFSAQLAASLDLPFTSETSTDISLRDSLFIALAAVAPGPTVP